MSVASAVPREVLANELSLYTLAMRGTFLPFPQRGEVGQGIEMVASFTACWHLCNRITYPVVTPGVRCRGRLPVR
jgi:hypothetical protein